ncbi:MAG: site-2 protease family protein [Candidatus Taylorbacteria bacterium]|nr:site-2 protease family protein [Candidatus Taylorbacteria bacterium]
MEITFIFSLIVLVMSVVVHEVAHAYTAEFLGDPTARLEGRITLNPLKHLDMIGSILVPTFTFMTGGVIFGWAKPVPFNPYNLKNRKWGEALVALAGPFSNLFLAVFFSFIIRYQITLGLPASFLDISILIIFTNISLAVFNLIPIPPLDGSKILFSLLPLRFEYVRMWVEKYSLILVVVLLFFLWQFIVPIIPWLFRLFTGV